MVPRHLHFYAGFAKGGEARQDREPAGQLHLDLGRRIALRIGRDLPIDALANVFAGGDGGALSGLIIAGKYANAVHPDGRSEEHTSELQSLMRISYAVFCLTTNTTLTLYLPPTYFTPTTQY